MRTRALAVLAGLAASAGASAYVLQGFDWMWDPYPVSMPWELNSTSFPGSTGSLLEIEDAFVASMDAWTDAPNPYFAWTYGGTTTDVSWGTDGRMIAQWNASTSNAGTLAVTQVIFYAGDVSECDMRFYGANAGGPIDWSADPAGAPGGSFDLQKVATHELGHCLGLDHSSNSGAIMYASTGSGTPVSDRDLHADDIAGLDAIYSQYVPRASLDLVSFETIDLGDGDGYHEAGELVGVELVVDNLGQADAIGAEAILSSTSADLLVDTAVGTPPEADHPALSTRTYTGAQLQIAPDCTLDGFSEYEVRLDADNVNTGIYWVIDIDLLCLGPDLDGDGVPESQDLCEGHDDSKDRDGDGVPNRCDPCPDDASDDSDGDGVCDADDVCAGFDDTADSDGDLIPDGCDEPDPAASEEPGGCGCATQSTPSPWLGWLPLLWLAQRRRRPAR